MISDYIHEAREPTLLLGTFSGVVGLAAALYYGSASVFLGILAIVGAVLAQLSVNMIDDYVDFKVGLDRETSKTKFSGGSGLLVGKKVKPGSVLAIALAALAIAGIVGAYLLLSASNVAWLVALTMAIGGAGVLLYARYMTHVPLLAEPFCALSFALIGIGVFLVSSNGTSHLMGTALVCTLAGVQVGAILVANEVPDMKPDRKYGRRSWVVILGSAKSAGLLYAGFQGVGYVVLVIGMMARYIPAAFAIMLAFVPIMQYIAMGIRRYKNAKAHEGIMGVSAAMGMAYMLALSAAYLLAGIFA